MWRRRHGTEANEIENRDRRFHLGGQIRTGERSGPAAFANNRSSFESLYGYLEKPDRQIISVLSWHSFSKQSLKRFWRIIENEANDESGWHPFQNDRSLSAETILVMPSLLRIFPSITTACWVGC
jgi:hypothetical protein